MDEFKKYIQNNREELDIDEPRTQVWQNISRETQGVQKPSVVMMVTRWAVAACVIALAGVGVWSVLHTSSGPASAEVASRTESKPAVTPVIKDSQTTAKDPATAETTLPADLTAAVTPEIKTTPAQHKPKTVTGPAEQTNKEAMAALESVENSFTQVINLQRDRVSSMPMYAESPEYFRDFKVQIRQMEKDEKVIKSDIAKRGMNDELLDQLINLYQQKLNTLKQLQIEMNKTNNRYKQNHGTVEPAKTYFLNL